MKIKLIGSPGWYIFLGLAFGWIGTAAASETWRNRLFIVGLIMVLIMTIAEMVYHVRRSSPHA
jgi:hypothetical protein